MSWRGRLRVRGQGVGVSRVVGEWDLVYRPTDFYVWVVLGADISEGVE